jgi:hypothetical protein
LLSGGDEFVPAPLLHAASATPATTAKVPKRHINTFIVAS